MSKSEHRAAKIATNDRIEGWNVWRDCAFAMAAPRKNALPRETYMASALDALLQMSPAARAAMEPAYWAARQRVNELQVAEEHDKAVLYAWYMVNDCEREVARCREHGWDKMEACALRSLEVWREKLRNLEVER